MIKFNVIQLNQRKTLLILRGSIYQAALVAHSLLSQDFAHFHLLASFPPFTYDFHMAPQGQEMCVGGLYTIKSPAKVLALW